MIIIKIQGGLGNQMFQFALGLGLLEKTKQHIKFDFSGLNTGITKRFFGLDKFNADTPTASTSDVKFFTQEKKYPRITKIKKMFRFKIPQYITDNHSFSHRIFDISDNAYLDGYWQSEKYFPEDKEIIRKAFAPKRPLGPTARKIAERIDNSSISIHIRRGDYITNKKVASKMGACNLEYYQKAISKATEGLDNPKIFAFSDDIEWVKENLKTRHSIIFVSEHNLENWEEITIMSICGKHIISNSSFGWWGAWLDPRDNKVVITPKQWYKDTKLANEDIIPPSWIRI